MKGRWMATDNQFLSQLVPWFENLNTTQVHTKKLGNMKLTFLRPFSKELRKATISSIMSVCPTAWKHFATGRIFIKFCVENF